MRYGKHATWYFVQLHTGSCIGSTSTIVCHIVQVVRLIAETLKNDLYAYAPDF